jgi:predicted glycoside hydrolase/deacetylase ChbG (UPF0249 family)
MVNERRMLIVNADDFGLNDAVNRGIVRAYDEGIVSSASLMVRRPGTSAAARAGAERPGLSIGLHLDFGDWRYRDGRWVVSDVPVDLDDRRAVAQEWAVQVDRFRDVMGRDPTHLDSHHHVHRHEPFQDIAREWAVELDVPLRAVSGGVRYCGEFHGQSGRGEPFPAGITIATLQRVMRSLPEGVTELACHPGDGAAGASVYDRERAVECAVLCDPAAFETIAAEHIAIMSFH